MAVSLEARVPLLDRRIIEFSFALAEDIRYHHGEPKGLLRHAYRGILPDSILDRRKKGFGIPRYYLKDLGGGSVYSGARASEPVPRQVMNRGGVSERRESE